MKDRGRPVCACISTFFAGTSGTAVGGLRGALGAPELAGFEGRDGCAAAVAEFLKSCGFSALGATALRTGTAGPVPTWGGVGSAFVVGCWAWVYGVQPFFFAAAWASAVGNP
ncbi:MAG: hypothetical protein ACM3WP_08665, partial [Acidobacteriota bacterium]